MIFTEELFEQVAPTANFTRPQMLLFGEKWPQVAGWKKRIIGSEITNEHFKLLLAFRKQLTDRKLSGAKGYIGKSKKELNKENVIALSSLPPVVLQNIKTEDWTRKTLMKEDSKTYLEVPYAEKDEVKSLGAKWDIQVKKWYVIGDTSIFYKWVNHP